MPKSPDSSSTFDLDFFSKGHSLRRSLFPRVPSNFVSFFFYFVYFLSDTLFQELPLCRVALASFFWAPSVHTPAVSSFFFVIVSLYLHAFSFLRAIRGSFIVPIPYAASPPLLMHPRQPPSPGPSLCVLHTWPCRGPGHHARLSRESFFFCFCFAFAHSSRSALLVLFPHAACPDALHTTSSPPASSAVSTQPASCVVCRCPGPPFLL